MWEALTAIGTIASAIVIAVTVLVGARQVRLTVAQLEQVRRSTQFDAARTVLLEMVEPSFVDGYRFLYRDLGTRMHDEAFRDEVALIGLADDDVHQELVILRSLDRIGTYVRFGLVDRDVIYSSYRNRIVVCWERLREVVAIHRKITDAHFWENVEFLYDDCKRWAAEHNRVVDANAAFDRIAQWQEGSQIPPEGPAPA